MQQDHGPEPDYNFIMNPASPAKRNIFTSGGQKQRILIAVTGGAILLVVFILLFSLIFGGGTNNMEKMAAISVKQAEIVRVAAIGEKDATSSDTRNFASTVRLSLTSAQNNLTSLLGKQGRKVQPKELAAGQNKQTDEALTEAKQANRFDEVFTEIIKESLKDYQQDLAAVYRNAGSSEQATLKALYESSAVLTGED